MGTALHQFFGIITGIDCTEDLWLVGSAMFIVGIIIGAICYHIITTWD